MASSFSSARRFVGRHVGLFRWHYSCSFTAAANSHKQRCFLSAAAAAAAEPAKKNNNQEKMKMKKSSPPPAAPAPALPLLMLSSPQKPQSRFFFDLLIDDTSNDDNKEDKKPKLKLNNRKILLPALAGHHCIGCSQGFLITIDISISKTTRIHATNPLTGATLPLPSTPALAHLKASPEWNRIFVSRKHPHPSSSTTTLPSFTEEAKPSSLPLSPPSSYP